MLRFESPIAFLLLLLAPLLLDASIKEWILHKLRIPLWRRLRPERAIPFSSGVPLSGLPTSLIVRLRGPILSALRLLAFLFLIIALARPQTGTAFAETEERGRDLLLALDVSGSMDAIDFQLDGDRVNRLEALKAVVAKFIDQRQGDRMGLVVFGSEVFTLCPLTSDHALLKDLVSSLAVNMAGDGTALGDGIAIALRRIKDIPAESKAVVLVTDGIRTAGQLDPKEAAEVARKLNVKIYSIGIGGDAPAPFKTKNIFGIESVEYRDVPMDEEGLRAVAEISGGRYFNATNTEELQKIYAEIDRLQETNRKLFQHIEYEEQFFVWGVIGLFMLIVAEALEATALRVLP